MEALYAKYVEFTTWETDVMIVDKNTHLVPWTTVVIYFGIVFLGPKIVGAISPKGFNIKPLMAFWNLVLSVFSLGILVGLGSIFFYNISTYGLEAQICDPENKVFLKPSPMVFWGILFALSKYAELLDTVFLVLKHPNRPVPFLHWFHHFTVLLFTWYALYFRYSAGAFFVVMNAFIHTFMYFYYFLREIDVYVPKSIAKLITVAQIAQMFGGIFFNSLWAYYYFYLGKKCICAQPEIMLISCAIMYACYLYLFLQFFYKRYVLGIVPESAGHGDAKKSSQQPKFAAKKHQ